MEGFKSYKDQTVIEPFSPGTNVIVGRNGSGKSNFFAAIRFVLSDAYTNLSREERQALLHEGSGSAVMSAYVEIIFDNTDKRFSEPGDEVVIRRTIGPKKDEYSVDRKVQTRADVLKILETAGFAKENPFYIVPQGRIAAITNMKESERLNLLKEIAGTNTYDDRRIQSLKIMAETNSKREKIDETLAYIEERLKELEEEKDELQLRTKNAQLDRERHNLETALQRQAQVERNLKDLDDSITAYQAELTQDFKKALTASEERQLEEFTTEVHRLQRELKEPEQIESRLRKVNEALKKYKHINKKAFDQYNSFTTQRDQLLKRRKELDTSQKSIEALIEHLDQEKDEAIERTFKQVKWDALELSDDSDIEVHPNVDKRSFIRAKQHQIHMQRQERRHKIETLKYERIINDTLIKRITQLHESLKAHAAEAKAGNPGEVAFRVVMQSAASLDPKDDQPPPRPEG
ncbi:hypothetical protein VTJ49DRAFT_5529 [Mycothermus thermophilus]|uniref:Cdc37 N-terminal domain-containing protein n=1 Tax=Humicola insolens TaxID=85995 RepID=A0ABR3V302_HUMIN